MAYTPNMYERRPVPGYSRWEADSLGRVYRDGSEYLGHDNRGYVMVCDGKDTIKRAWLVAFAFHGHRPMRAVIRHLNDIKNDDRPANLKWGNRSEDRLDAYRNGRLGKLTQQDAEKIREMYATGDWLQREIADIFNVKQSAIGKIVRRESWCHI